MLTSPQTVFAEFEHQSPTDKLAEINRPVPPRYGYSLVPPRIDGYHQNGALPITAQRWADVDLSEQRVVVYERG